MDGRTDEGKGIFLGNEWIAAGKGKEHINQWWLFLSYFFFLQNIESELCVCVWCANPSLLKIPWFWDLLSFLDTRIDPGLRLGLS